MNRRKLLKSFASLPFVGSFLNSDFVYSKHNSEYNLNSTQKDLYKDLGVRTFINCAGTYTALTGSLMPKEVTDAITFGTSQYVELDELQDRVGERISELLECEYATISSGCFGAMSIATAGVMCGMDNEKVAQLPNTDGIKNEVIMQESHYMGYCQALTNVGAKLIKIKSTIDLEKSINSKTAMLWFLNAGNDKGSIKWQEFVDLGKKHNIPTFIDCAADVPPVDNLFKYTKMGFDLVAFSGGKGLRGPQSAGLLLGNRKLIEAARLHTPPRGETIGRGMKVNKEEVLGMLTALELYLNKNHDEEWKMWEGQIKMISDSAKSVDGVKSEVFVPKYANHVPSLKIFWDPKNVKITPNQFRHELRIGHPSIETTGDNESVGVTTWMMEPGQERTVSRRIREVFSMANHGYQGSKDLNSDWMGYMKKEKA
ncbi:MAG: aminotransferase class V-fold PLP-dependent enzyme [Flavobacteriaceae bacterium]|nr:aminotransferase class V-fold PLP-dependent enzyme [Flavobacteriaceae bacterium]